MLPVSIYAVVPAACAVSPAPARSPQKNRLDIFPGNEKFLHLLPGLTVLCIGRFLATQHLGILLVELSDGRDFRFALTVMSK